MPLLPSSLPCHGIATHTLANFMRRSLVPANQGKMGSQVPQGTQRHDTLAHKVSAMSADTTTIVSAKIGNDFSLSGIHP